MISESQITAYNGIENAMYHAFTEHGLTYKVKQGSGYTASYDFDGIAVHLNRDTVHCTAMPNKKFSYSVWNYEQVANLICGVVLTSKYKNETK